MNHQDRVRRNQGCPHCCGTGRVRDDEGDAYRCPDCEGRGICPAPRTYAAVRKLTPAELACVRRGLEQMYKHALTTANLVNRRYDDDFSPRRGDVVTIAPPRGRS